MLKAMGVPLLIHQPNYSMLNRWIEDGLLDTLAELGVGCICFSPLAQGLLTDKYLDGVPAGFARRPRLHAAAVADDAGAASAGCGGSTAIARTRGQSLAQLALAWVLRDPGVTSALIGARTVEQLDDSLDALNAPAAVGRGDRRDRGGAGVAGGYSGICFSLPLLVMGNSYRAAPPTSPTSCSISGQRHRRNDTT